MTNTNDFHLEQRYLKISEQGDPLDSREVNKKIKEGVIPECITQNPSRCCQKDVDARWTKKNGQNYYGYKNHVNADTKHKLIRKYEVTSASTSDIHCFVALLDERNDDNKVWADSAYYSEKTEKILSEKNYQSRLIRRYKNTFPEWSEEDRKITRRAKIRKRVEHIFGFMENSMGGMFIRTIGIARTKTKIGLQNLVYNFCRFEQLERLGVA